MKDPLCSLAQFVIVSAFETHFDASHYVFEPHVDFLLSKSKDVLFSREQFLVFFFTAVHCTQSFTKMDSSSQEIYIEREIKQENIEEYETQTQDSVTPSLFNVGAYVEIQMNNESGYRTENVSDTESVAVPESVGDNEGDENFNPNLLQMIKREYAINMAKVRRSPKRPVPKPTNIHDAL